MELDEAIKHAEEKAREWRVKAEGLRDIDIGNPNVPVKYCLERAEEHRQLAEWLKELQQLREQTRWILVSERLPKEDGRYYVTRNDYVTKTDFTDLLWYEKGIWWNRQSTGDYAVIAWMPKPEPYKSESEEA